MRVRYADATASLEVRHIFTYDRKTYEAPVMSSSSGPKDYFRNAVSEVFARQPAVVKVVIVRGCASAFALLQAADGQWYDMTAKEVIIERQEPLARAEDGGRR